MLYEIREAQRSILNPVSGWADAMSKLFSNPYSPFSYTPMATRVAAGFELMFRLGKEYEKPGFGIETVTIEGTRVAITEKVEVTKPFLSK